MHTFSDTQLFHRQFEKGLQLNKKKKKKHVFIFIYLACVFIWFMTEENIIPVIIPVILIHVVFLIMQKVAVRSRKRTGKV